jgi:hypothetical protein
MTPKVVMRTLLTNKGSKIAKLRNHLAPIAIDFYLPIFSLLQHGLACPAGRLVFYGQLPPGKVAKFLTGMVSPGWGIVGTSTTRSIFKLPTTKMCGVTTLP